MTAIRRPSGRSSRSPRARTFRYTIDASVFVNAFNPHEKGHAASLRLLAAIQERGDPVLIPTLLLPEVASAIARATGDGPGALRYANAIAGLPHLTMVSMTMTTTRQAADLASSHRLRAADSVYVAVARRYATTLVSRDEEQHTRGSGVSKCQTPEETLADRPDPPVTSFRKRIASARSV